MNGHEQHNPMAAGDERLAELYVRDLLGEDLDAHERAELDAARAQHADLLDALSAAHDQLLSAAAVSTPREGFAARVMQDLKIETIAGPRPLESDGSGILTAYVAPATARRGWGWAVAAAALLALGVGIGWQAGWMNTEPSTDAPAVAHLQLRKGGLIDADGRAVDAEALQPGHVYRVRAGEEAVLRTRRDGALRLLADAEFQAPDPAADSDLALKNGTVYAHSADSREPVVVEAPVMRAAVEGVSMVMQEPLPANADEEAAGMGQCIVVVIRGVAHVDTRHHEPVMVRQDEVLVSGLTPESIRIFMNKVKERAQALETLPDDPVALRRQRIAYTERVDDYSRQLSELDSAIKGCTDDLRLAELRDRRERVNAYLVQHRDRLARFPSNGQGDEAPARRARRLRRAADKIEEGRQAYLEPERWM